MARIDSQLQSIYALGKVQHNGEELRLEPHLEAIMADVRQENEGELAWAWKAWRQQIGPPMKELYEQYVDLANEGARDNGTLNI